MNRRIGLSVYSRRFRKDYDADISTHSSSSKSNQTEDQRETKRHIALLVNHARESFEKAKGKAKRDEYGMAIFSMDLKHPKTWDEVEAFRRARGGRE